MRKIRLGKTGLSVTKTSFGALPIQRLTVEDAADILRAARDAGVNYFDTARAYSDSEHKLSVAFAGLPRDQVIIATKTGAKNAEIMRTHLAESLSTLGTAYIDVYQFHNPPFIPKPGGEDGLYDAASAARDAGQIRFIGITQHSLEGAFQAVESGLYDVLQYPFNHLATEREIALVRLCAEKNIGFVAMKAMSGGLITDAAIPFAYISTFENVVPIWGIQRKSELEQFIRLEAELPQIDDAMRKRIEKDRRELAGAFCRSCGYCLPCPADIPIPMANRITQLLTRSPSAQWLTDEWRKNMEKVEQCMHCGLCESRCPYNLKPYETMPDQLRFYRESAKKFDMEQKNVLR